LRNATSRRGLGTAIPSRTLPDRDRYEGTALPLSDHTKVGGSFYLAIRCRRRTSTRTAREYGAIWLGDEGESAMSENSTLKVKGSERDNRASGREWLSEWFKNGWHAVDYAYRRVLCLRSDAIERAIEVQQCQNAPVRIRNVYTGDVEAIACDPVITVTPQPTAGRLEIEHERIQHERYYLVTTQTTCLSCRPEKGNRYPDCDSTHPDMVREVWRFVRKTSWYPPRYGPTALAVNGIRFVNLANALKAADQAKASIFDCETGRLIPYGIIASALFIFHGNVTKVARMTEAKGLEFWDNMS
jgi:hypothetical protein